jgi:hypothetical protein
LHQSPKALVLFVTRWAAEKVSAHARHSLIRVAGRQLALDIDIEQLEALLATQFRPRRTEQPREQSFGI